MESAIAKRKKEIECELLLLEVSVWKDLDKEQQALVNAEQEKLDNLTNAVFELRSSYEEEMRKFRKGVASVAGRRANKSSTPQQTEPVRAVTEMYEVELNSLRKETATLEREAELRDEQKRLQKEQQNGERFRRLREQMRSEEAACARLDQTVSELQQAIRTAELVAQDAATVDEDVHWEADAAADWDVAPWDDPWVPESGPQYESAQSGHGSSGICGSSQAKLDCKAVGQLKPSGSKFNSMGRGGGASYAQGGWPPLHHQVTPKEAAPVTMATGRTRFVPKKPLLFRKQ